VYSERLRVVEEWLRLREEGLTREQAAPIVGVSAIKLWRYHRIYEEHGSNGLYPGFARSGRRPDVLPGSDELRVVKGIFIRLNTGKNRSSKIAAFRMAAQSDDPAITETFRGFVLRRRTKALPASWMRLLDTPTSVIHRKRDPKSTMGAYISTPRNNTFVDFDGIEKPLRCGTIFESDDGTVNFPVWLKWPFGGDKCSDKYGVKVGRFQLLPVIDVFSGFIPSFDFIVRPQSSYRGEDVMALFGRVFSSIGRPEVLRLERGAWESNIVRDALKLANVPVFNAWHSKQKSCIENGFNRLWTPLSLLPGDVGRTRGEDAVNTKLLMECADGRRDPRNHFLEVSEATKRIGGAVQWCNSEPRQSYAWGQWVPERRWNDQIGERPLSKLAPELQVFFKREQREWTARKGLVGGKVAGPQMTFPIWFQFPELWEFDGCRVKCFFDPYESPCLGTIVLQDAWRGYKPGHVIARDVQALDLPPQVVLCKDGFDDADGQKGLAIRKAVSNAIRTETWDYLGGRTSAARDGLGNSTKIEHGSRTNISAPAPARKDEQRKRIDRIVSREQGDWRELDDRTLVLQDASVRDSSGVTIDELNEL
jgi:hypothetical protein